MHITTHPCLMYQESSSLNQENNIHVFYRNIIRCFSNEFLLLDWHCVLPPIVKSSSSESCEDDNVNVCFRCGAIAPHTFLYF